MSNSADLITFWEGVPNFIQHLSRHFSTKDTKLAETLHLRVEGYVQVIRAILARAEEEI